MKKGVLLLIAIVFVISIVVVAFFGVSASNISPIIYTTSVEILDMDGNEIDGEWLFIDFVPDPNLTDEDGTQYMQYFFSTRTLPENATYTNFVYSSDNENYIICTHRYGGGFLIKESIKVNPTDPDPFEMATITCTNNDGGEEVSDSINLVVMY